MGTTLQQDTTFFNETKQKFGNKKPNKTRGTLKFAGNYWPAKQLVRHDVQFAIEEARKVVVAAYIKAALALGNNQEAKALMKRWFGDRFPSPVPNPPPPDWWSGAKAILGGIEDFILKDINIYYRGDDSLIGRPTDYPGETGNLDANDVRGYAESATGVSNNVIGLCKSFFRKNSGRAVVSLTGKDCVAGVIIHELSHNVCNTEDHQTHDDSEDCYAAADCLALATNKPSRAWYNANNIEYFCEEAYYGTITA